MADRSFSCSTATTSNETVDERLSELTSEQLALAVKDLEDKNGVLAIETEMFERFYKKQDTSSLNLSTSFAPTSHAPAGEAPRPTGRKRSKVRCHAIDRTIRLSTEQKCNISQKEVERIKEEMAKAEEDSEKVLDLYKAMLEECEVRLREMEKEKHEIERDTKKHIAERIIRAFEDRLKAKEALIEKLRLKNATQKTQMKKLLLQLKQKEEMGEALHAVDFNQLMIENQQYLEKIEEKNNDLLRLKQDASKKLQHLNMIKKKLQELMLESNRLKTEIQTQKDLCARIDAEYKQVIEEKIAVDKMNISLKEYLSDYQVPAIMEFVQEKANLTELRRIVKTWERKVEIAEMGYKSCLKKWHSMTSQH